jgi:nitrogen fixation protein NifU and related proteins
MDYQTYTKEVMKNFKNPKNMGKIENPDGTGRVGNAVCGDLMELYINVKKVKGKEIISDIKFQTFGCVAAISTSSMITTLAKGKTIEEALKITRKDITQALGGLPSVKIHCSVLAADALAEAVYDYFSKNKLPISNELKEIHERIIKQTHEVEEKHKEYTDMEKKMFRK